MELAGVASEGAATLEQTKALLAERPERFFIAVLDLNLPDAADGEVVDYVSQFDIPIIVAHWQPGYVGAPAGCARIIWSTMC